MNNTPSPAKTSTNDLVLQLMGGDRDGQLLPVQTAKCLLSSLIRDKADAEKYRCAIFRGSKGVAFRSYSDHVLVNGSKVSVQWLKQGDLISLTPDLTVVVKQLGVFDAANPVPENVQRETQNTRKITSTIEVNPGLLSKAGHGSAASVRPIEVTDPIQSTKQAQSAPPRPQQAPAVDSKPNNPVPRGPVVTQALPVTPATGPRQTPTLDLDSKPDIKPNSPVARGPVITQALPVTPATSSSIPTADLTQTLESTSPIDTIAPLEVPALITPPAPETISDNVDERMNSLSDRLSTLVDAASGNPNTENPNAENPDAETTTAPAPSLATELEETKLSAASASIQDFLDKALESKDTSPPQPSNEQAAAPRVSEVTQELEALPLPTVDAPKPSATTTTSSSLRREEVTSSLERLLGGTAAKPPAPDQKTSVSSEISAAEQVHSPEPAPQAEPEISFADKLLADSQPPEPAAPVEPESKTRSLDFLKSLGVDASELGLSSDQAASPVNEPQLVSEESSAIAAPSTIEATTSVGNTVGHTEVDQDADESTDAEPAAQAVENLPEPVAATQKAESVADVLARMQNAGSLSSFNLDATEEEPVAAPIEPAPSIAVTEPKVAAVADEAQASDSASGDEDNAVEDYMSQLLNRMRGGDDEEPAKKSEAVAPPKPQKTEKTETASASTPAFVPEPELEKLTKAEFVPRQKAVRMQSLDSLREIANHSSRLAIQDHLANQRKVSTQTKFQLTIISLVFGVICFAMSCLFSPKVIVGGMLFGLAFLVMGVVMGYLYREERKLDESIVTDQK